MEPTIKITCTGKARHVNEVDLDLALQNISIPRVAIDRAQLPERVVLRCRFCNEGKVIITSEIWEDFLGTSDLI